jgi:protocatechuate 3,4-dioxygenase beta subunit
MKTPTLVAALLALIVASGIARQAPTQQPPQGQTGGRQGGGGGQGQRGGAQAGAQDAQPRDTTPATPATSSITGRVVTADTGKPVKRAQVRISGTGRGGRSTITDDQGVYTVTALSAGSYTVTASKNGFVDAVYGQRRPLQPGTPVQLTDNQRAGGVDLRLIRGGVITGHVLDEDGEPLMRAVVAIQRYQYLQGNRQLTPAGGDQTDDRGVYRVFGLPAGDYYVSVSVAGLGQFLGRGLQQLAAGIGGFGGPGGRGGRGAGFGAVDETEASGYAPTYYPGVVSASDAGKVTVGPGQEVGGIDFQIQLVPFATVGGIVGGADNNSGITVTLAPQDTNARGPLGGTVMNGRTAPDGSFSIPNVPPGHYVAIARSGGRQNDQRIGVTPVAVNGQNIGGLPISLQAEITMSGNITVESSGTPSPTDYSGFRVDAPEVTPLPFVGGGGPGGRGGGNGRAAANGTFSVPNLVPGKHYVRITGQGFTQGMTTGTQWNLKAVLAGGADVTDAGIELKPGENVDNVTIVLTDRSTTLTGTVRDASQTPVPALTVIAFPSDQQYWRAQSRWIQAARTDQTGTYRLRGLPPGDYLLYVTDNVEQGEWFDPSFLEQIRNASTRVSLNEGDQKTQDLSGPS